jgi:hypothetical protein
VGTYQFAVIATDGTITHRGAATLQVQAPPPPAILGVISPASATLSPGQSANLELTLISENNATGTATFQCSNLSTGSTCTFNPTTTTLPSNGNVTDQLTVQVTSATPVGTYPFTVVATVGTITQQIAATLQVQAPPNFSGSITPSSATLSVGQSANFSITLNSQNGANGSVSLACLNVPSGTTCAFNPTAANLPANGSASDTLTVQVNSRPTIAPPVTSIPWTPTGGWPGTLPFLAGLLLAIFVIVAAGGDRKQRLAALAVLLFVAAALLVATLACGGGGSTGSSTPAPAPVTFTISVQASGAGVSTPQSLGSLTITVN